jgi:hypothetical protein
MRRQLLAATALLGAFTLGAGTASAAGAPQWAQTGTAYTDTLGGGQGLASRADGSLLYRGWPPSRWTCGSRAGTT